MASLVSLSKEYRVRIVQFCKDFNFAGIFAEQMQQNELYSLREAALNLIQNFGLVNDRSDREEF